MCSTRSETGGLPTRRLERLACYSLIAWAKRKGCWRVSTQWVRVLYSRRRGEFLPDLSGSRHRACADYACFRRGGRYGLESRADHRTAIGQRQPVDAAIWSGFDWFRFRVDAYSRGTAAAIARPRPGPLRPCRLAWTDVRHSRNWRLARMGDTWLSRAGSGMAEAAGTRCAGGGNAVRRGTGRNRRASLPRPSHEGFRRVIRGHRRDYQDQREGSRHDALF